MPILLGRDEFDKAIKELHERLIEMEKELGETFCIKYNSIAQRLGRIEQALIELKSCKCEEPKEVKRVTIKKK